MTPRREGPLEGWSIVGVNALLVASSVGATFAFAGAAETGVRAAIRTTATTSFVLFLAAFVASSACTLWPSSPTKWMLRNRRPLGVSFAVSQLVHLALVTLLIARFGESFWRRVAMTTIVGGGLGYVFTAAMTITSFDRTAAWLGRRRWRLLHRTGMYATFGIFFFSYVLLAGRRAHYAAYSVVLVLALGLRLVVALRQRRSRR